MNRTSLLVLITMSASLAAQSVTYTGDRSLPYPDRHDGGARPAVGVQEHALFRPTNSTATAAGAMPGHAVSATRFNHHPFLTYWRGRFWAYSIGFQYDESTKGGYLQWSSDGRTWHQSDRTQVFPAPLATHQRMAFYLAANDVLLVSTWYSQNGEAGRGGVGSRLVRRINGPGDLGPIHVLRHNVAGGASGIGYPLYTSSGSSAFRSACAELLADPASMQQMWEEDQDRSAASPYEIWSESDGEFDAKGFTWYRVGGPSGRMIGQWKGGYFGITSGGTWARDAVARDRDLTRFGEHRSAKMWGQPTADGGYAMFWSGGASDLPGTAPWYGWDSRTPLRAATSADGWTYDGDALVISGDSGPQLFRNGEADNKTVGASYTRGIQWLADREARSGPAGGSTWVTYSTNKEYIWVTEVPAVLTGSVDHHVDEDFAGWTPGGRVGDWNIRNGGWTPVQLVDAGGETVLRLQDKDRYDYAKAFRVFKQEAAAAVTTRVRAGQTGGELQLELVDAAGRRPVRLRMHQGAWQRQAPAGGWIELGTYAAGTWYELTITCDAPGGRFSVAVDGRAIATDAPLAEAASSIERVEYRTGAWRLDDFSTNAYGSGTPGYRSTDLDGAHEPVATTRFDVAGLRTGALVASGDIIASIDWVSSGAAYVEAPAADGQRLYIDRDYQLSGLPTGFEQGRMIRTRNDDDGATANPHLEFTLSARADVFVAYRADAARLPDWMSGWSDSGIVVDGQGAGTFRLYRNIFDAGQVVLGANERGTTQAASNYVVIARPASGGDGGTVGALAAEVVFDPTDVHGWDMGELLVRNHSESTAITRVELTLSSGGFDYLQQAAFTTEPALGGNNDGVVAGQVALAWSGGLAAGSDDRAEADIDGSMGTIAARVVFADGSVLEGALVDVGDSDDGDPRRLVWDSRVPSAIAINFQPASVPVVEGWLVDAGRAYGDRGNGRVYGWDQDTFETRDRNLTSDQLRDTLNHCSKHGDRSWELALPAGVYEVDLLCGDPAHTDQVNHLEVEGVRAVDPDGMDHFDRHVLTVEVGDGRLTIRPASDADNAKLVRILVTPLGGNG